ncbi:MAG: DUF3990 domain-containing protein [Paludibacteraceae bacterium]|nr:DUF3990 domain-containing protein [Paludibacteraceae bacterium]
MILYHGTNVDFSEIDFAKSNKNKDFGCGFYLTDIFEQAQHWAIKKSEIFGGTAIVQRYEFDEKILVDSNLKILRFESPTEEWAEFVFNNRRRNQQFVHDYDIVIGPIADDGVAYLLARYAEGSFTLKDLAKELEYKYLNIQYFFGTKKAIDFLKRIYE